MKRLILVALLACSLASCGESYCERHPDGVGCIGTHEITDDADRVRADERDAQQDANQAVYDQVCADARDAGDEEACR